MLWDNNMIMSFVYENDDKDPVYSPALVHDKENERVLAREEASNPTNKTVNAVPADADADASSENITRRESDHNHDEESNSNHNNQTHKMNRSITPTNMTGGLSASTTSRITNSTISSNDTTPAETEMETNHTTTTNYKSNINHNTIRRFGCHRTEMPAIFVHLGKAGGGNVRARFAAGAQNYNRSNYKHVDADEHYYPLPQQHNNNHSSTMLGQQQQSRGGKFCNSAHYWHLPEPARAFEEVQVCRATHPLSMAIACPEPLQKRCRGCEAFILQQQQAGSNDDNHTRQQLLLSACHTLYVGHNHLGSEIHWLPPKFLQRWWHSLVKAGRVASSSNKTLVEEQIAQELAHLDPQDRQWCRQKAMSRPEKKPDIDCMQAKARQLDALVRGVQIQRRNNNQDGYAESTIITTTMVHTNNPETRPNERAQTDYSSLYASIPVHRMIVLREPFDWLLSQFFWHKFTRAGVNCTHFDRPIKSKIGKPSPWPQKYILENYLLTICGVDCSNRWYTGKMTVEEMEIQATNNLRQSFSVVGLLEDLDSFYSMVSRRLSYIDMSLNPHVQGVSHPSRKTQHQHWCKKKFHDPLFRDYLREKVPIMRRLERIYAVGLEVNRFQKEELESCHSSNE